MSNAILVAEYGFVLPEGDIFSTNSVAKSLPLSSASTISLGGMGWAVVSKKITENRCVALRVSIARKSEFRTLENAAPLILLDLSMTKTVEVASAPIKNGLVPSADSRLPEPVLSTRVRLVCVSPWFELLFAVSPNGGWLVSSSTFSLSEFRFSAGWLPLGSEAASSVVSESAWVG